MSAYLITRIALGLSVTWLTVCASVTARADGEMIVKDYGDVEYVPVNPQRPEAAQIAILWGDPDSGPSAMLLKMAGATGLLHTHSSDYHLVVIEGVMKHRAQDQDEAAVPTLGSGSYWYQPGGRAHADSCLSEHCVMFIRWDGPRDIKLVE